MIHAATTKKLAMLAACAAILLTLVGGALGSGALAAEANAGRCALLMAYYDRYVFWPDDSTPIGYMQREMGEQECKAGRYQSGIDELTMAIRLIGFTAPQ